MNSYLKGILKGLEISYKRIDEIDPENKNIQLTGAKLVLLRTLQKWRQLAFIRELNVNDLDKIQDINDMDELDKKLCQLNKNYIDFISGTKSDFNDEDLENESEDYNPKYVS